MSHSENKKRQILRKSLSGVIDFAAAMMLVVTAINSAQAQTSVSVDGVEQDIVGNTGPVSVIVDGTNFDDATAFETIDVNGAVYPSTKQKVLAWSKAIATFNLNQAAPGQAKIRVTKSGQTATLEAGFVIAADRRGELQYDLTIPERVKPGETATVMVNYRNGGYADVDIPVLVLHVPGAQFVGRAPDGKNYGEYVSVLGVPQAPVYPVLRPGESVSIPFYVKPGAADTPVKLYATTPSDANLSSLKFDYNSLINSAPPEAQPAMTGYVQQLTAENGANVSEYYQRQVQKVSELADREAHQRYNEVHNIDGAWELQPADAAFAGFQLPPDNQPIPADLPPTTPLVSPQVPAGTGDGVKKTWVVIVSAGDYGGVSRQRMDLPGANLSGCMVYDFFNLGLGVPTDQITWLNDRKRDSYTLSPLNVSDAVRGLKGKADADDSVVIWYNGHGSPDSWFLPGGGYSPDNLSGDLDFIGAGGNYVFSDSCYAGAFVDGIHSKNTAAFGACESNQYSSEITHWSEGLADNERFANTTNFREDIGGMFTYAVLKHLRRGDSLEASFKASGADAQAMITKFLGSNVQTPSTNMPNNDFGQCSVDTNFPFGQVVNPYKQVTTNTFDSITEGLVGADQMFHGLIRLQAQPSNPAASYIPGGVAVCPHKKMFFISDNSRGRIVMVNPKEQQNDHRYVEVITGLVAPGDIDIGAGGHSLVYTDDNRVKSQFFGFTAYIADQNGTALSGAEAVVESAAGKYVLRVDINGYLNVWGLDVPKIKSRKVLLTIKREGKTHSFSFDLDSVCQTFHKLVFKGTGVIEDQKPQWPADPKKPVPPDAPIPPVVVPVSGGKTSLVPPWILQPQEPLGPGSAPRTIKIITPADELITKDAEQVLSGSVSDAAIREVTCFVNNVPLKLPVENGGFSARISLAEGVNDLYCREINASGVQAESEHVQAAVDPNFNGSTGAIVGSVINGNSYSGTANARVRNNTSGQEVRTDAQGYYTFNGAAAGAAEIEVLPWN